MSYVEEGLRHHNAGDLDKAEQCYLDAVAANSSDAQALKLLAVLQIERGMADDALSYAEAAANLRPADGECAHLLGRIHVELGQFSEAVPVLRRATQKNPPNPMTVWFDLALCLERTDAMSEARRAFGEVLAKDPDHRAALHGAGRAALALGEADAAADFYRRATKIDGNDAEAWAGLAKAELQRGNLDTALTHAEHACSIAPGMAPAVAARNEVRAAMDAAANLTAKD